MNDGHARPRGLLTALTVALVIGVVALVVSFMNALELGEQSDQRERDRIASDVTACERGNVLRQQVRDMGAATDDTFRTVLDTIFANVRPSEASTELRRLLDVPLAEFHTAVQAIELTDCRAAVPGAKEER